MRCTEFRGEIAPSWGWKSSAFPQCRSLDCGLRSDLHAPSAYPPTPLLPLTFRPNLPFFAPPSPHTPQPPSFLLLCCLSHQAQPNLLRRRRGAGERDESDGHAHRIQQPLATALLLLHRRKWQLPMAAAAWERVPGSDEVQTPWQQTDAAMKAQQAQVQALEYGALPFPFPARSFGGTGLGEKLWSSELRT